MKAWKGITISYMGSRIHVACDYDPAFVRGARELSGRWRHRSGVWTFPAESQRLLFNLLTRLYGPPMET